MSARALLLQSSAYRQLSHVADDIVAPPDSLVEAARLIDGPFVQVMEVFEVKLVGLVDM